MIHTSPFAKYEVTHISEILNHVNYIKISHLLSGLDYQISSTSQVGGIEIKYTCSWVIAELPPMWS